MIRMTALMLATVGIVTASADAALIDVGFTTSTEESSQAFDNDAETYLDQVKTNDGALPNSPNSIDVEEILSPDGLVATSSILREDDETTEITLDNIRYTQESDDTAMVFNETGSLASFDYGDNGESFIVIRGRRAGNDGDLFTNDDVILTDGDENADYIGIFAVGEGTTFDDTPANRTYFNDETQFEVETTVDLQRLQSTVARGTETVSVEGTVAVPTPSTVSMALAGFGFFALFSARRRSRCS